MRRELAQALSFESLSTRAINNDRKFAGIIEPLGTTWDTDANDWKRVIEVNTTGVWLCNKYQLRRIMKQDSIKV